MENSADFSTNNLQTTLDNLQRRSLLSQALREIYVQSRGWYREEISPIYIINRETWQNLKGVFRYLGGSPGTSDAKGFPADVNVKKFITTPGDKKKVVIFREYWKADTNDNIAVTRGNLQLDNFIPNTVSRLRQFGNRITGTTGDESLLVAMREIRNYALQRHQDVAKVLQNVAEGDIHVDLFEETYRGDTDVPDYAAFIIGRFLTGNSQDMVEITQVGIPKDVITLTDAENALLELHYPSSD